MYKLLFIRKNKGIGNKSIEDITETITEYKRQKVETNETENETENDSCKNDGDHSNKNTTYSDAGNQCKHQCNHEMVSKKIKIKINKNDYIPLDINERIDLYLKKFNSNISSIKSLPYYLIPLASSLYYYLNEKKRSNQYISTFNIDQKIKSTSSVNEIFDYEFEALVASSIAALTLTFLNIKSFNPFNSFKKNNFDNYDIDINIILKEQRLELQEKLNKDKIFDYMMNGSSNIQFKRNTQILAEFRNVLIINSNIMQILKLTDDLPEFQWLSTMHHYIWEEAYHAIVLKIKDENKQSINNIKSLFKELFYIHKVNDKKLFNSYIYYLNKNYCMVISSIIHNTF